MSSYYQIVWMPDLVAGFLKKFLPKIENSDYAFKISLVARKKYNGLASNITLGRIFVTMDKSVDIVINELYKLQCEVGCFKDAAWNTIPNDCLAVYMTLGFKDARKAVGMLVEKMLTGSEDVNFPLDYLESTISKTNGPCDLVQVDLDTKDQTIVSEVKAQFALLQIKVILAIETKNGYHVVANACESSKLRACRNIIGDVFTITKDPCVAVPGTYQGGWKVIPTDEFDEFIE